MESDYEILSICFSNIRHDILCLYTKVELKTQLYPHYLYFILFLNVTMTSYTVGGYKSQTLRVGLLSRM
jgi:hypothetical protein